MSEEKLYAVKNDEGKYLNGIDSWNDKAAIAFKSSATALGWAEIYDGYDGHVVTLIEEPEKVVLTKEQAEIVEKARVSDIPATYISARTDEYNGEESLLMNAYVNGYTVAKEKKYNVKVPHVPLYYWKKSDGVLGIDDLNAADDDTDDFEFTEREISDFGLQDCEKEEVTDDDD